MKRILFYITLFLFICSNTQGQSFRFDYYGSNEGIPEDFVYSIIQDDQGYLFVSTDEGIFKYNGFDFTNIYTDEPGVKILTSFKASNNDLWFGKSKNGIIKYSDNKFQEIILPAEELSRVKSISEDANGNIWVATQSSGIFKINELDGITHYFKGLEELNIYSFISTEDGLLIGTDMGLYIGEIEPDSVVELKEFESIFYSNITSIINSPNGYLIGTESLGGFMLNFDTNSKQFISMPLKKDEMDLSGYKINHIFDDNNNSLWVSTNDNGLIQLCTNGAGVCHDIVFYNKGGLNSVRTVSQSFIDVEGNLWLASIDEGIVGLRNDFFSFYPLNNITESREVLSLEVERNNRMWLGTENNVLLCNISPWSVVQKFSVEEGLPISEYTAIEKTKDGTLWVGSIDAGLYYKTTDSELFEKFSLPVEIDNKYISHIEEVEDKIYISSYFGLIEIVNGEVAHVYTIQDGIPHNKIFSVFSNDNKLWVATEANKICLIENDSINLKKIWMTSKPKDIGMTQYTTSTDGNVWVASDGSGISRVTGNDSLWFKENNGLMSNFVHSIIGDNNNKLWMSHRGGLSRYDIATNSFKTYNPVVGKKVDFSNNAVLKDDKGRLWFGTNRGVLRYRPELDLINNVSPKVSFVSVKVNDSIYSDSPVIDLKYNSKYVIRFDFEGISLKKPEEVTFEYFLSGYDPVDEFTGEGVYNVAGKVNFQTYNNLDPGNYEFKVKSYNADGVGGEEIYSVKFSIASPIWTQWWFFVIIGVAGYLIIRTIIKEREKQYIKSQIILQQKLDERTSEVVQQKEELQIINMDLMDSIDYAKTIQTAILPAPDSLSELFQNAAVFYKPRDVVSGDFYWVETYGDVTMVAVADCTGHGVPGAFMSLIGSALLKDISSRDAVNSPSVAMTFLDIEMKEMLNKKDSRFGVQDGMDITIIEYNKKTGVLRFSSGRRPVILYRDGKQEEIKGDRASIGGYRETDEKKFNLHEFQMKPGDRIYMYSDGIVDQFGGERGKKLKNKAFLAYLESIQTINMESQRDNMATFFDDWKGELAQIDDVIVVGIEV